MQTPPLIKEWGSISELCTHPYPLPPHDTNEKRPLPKGTHSPRESPTGPLSNRSQASSQIPRSTTPSNKGRSPSVKDLGQTQKSIQTRKTHSTKTPTLLSQASYPLGAGLAPVDLNTSHQSSEISTPNTNFSRPSTHEPGTAYSATSPAHSHSSHS